MTAGGEKNCFKWRVPDKRKVKRETEDDPGDPLGLVWILLRHRVLPTNRDMFPSSLLCVPAGFGAFRLENVLLGY